MRVRTGFISNSSTFSCIVALPASCPTLQEAEAFIKTDDIVAVLEDNGDPVDRLCEIILMTPSRAVVYQLDFLKAMLATLHPDGEALGLQLFDQDFQDRHFCKISCKMCAMLNKRMDSLVPRPSTCFFKPMIYRVHSYCRSPEDTIVTCFDCYTEFLHRCIIIRDWSNKLARMALPNECSFPDGRADPPAKTEQERAKNERHNMQQPVNALPNPVLLTVLSYLRLNEAVGPCLLVCRRWAALKLSARPTEDATACGVFWKPQALSYLRDMMQWQVHDWDSDAVFKVADIDACISPGFSGATQWQYLALSAFARWIRSDCSKPPRPKLQPWQHFPPPAPLMPITLMTHPCKALRFYDYVLGSESGNMEKGVIGGFLLRMLERAGVCMSGTVWQFLEWVRRQEEGGRVGFVSVLSDVVSLLRVPVFRYGCEGTERERERCEEERNVRRESVVEQWGFAEMWDEQEQRDREEEEEARRKREEEEHKDD